MGLGEQGKDRVTREQSSKGTHEILGNTSKLFVGNRGTSQFISEKQGHMYVHSCRSQKSNYQEITVTISNGYLLIIRRLYERIKLAEILLPAHPASFAHTFVSVVHSFYFSESQDAIVLHTCH